MDEFYYVSMSLKYSYRCYCRRCYYLTLYYLYVNLDTFYYVQQVLGELLKTLIFLQFL
jgi:hypothetical protein